MGTLAKWGKRLLMTFGAVLLLMVVGETYLRATDYAPKGSRAEPVAAAPSPAVAAVQRPATVDPVDRSCLNTRVSACFVNPDGNTCRNQMGTPYGTLFANGNYQVVSAVRDTPNRCTIGIIVSVSVNGSDYRTAAKIWGND